MKKYAIIIIITIGAILGILTGIYLYKMNQLNDSKRDIDIVGIEDECTKIAELCEKGELDLVRTNSEDKKTSPNCILTLKVYYNKCGHLIEKKEKIKQAEVNMTENELKDKFKEWEIQKFTPNEIVLYKEVDEFCNEHYLVKEKDGYITIFSLDENNNENFLEMTEFSIDYLTKEDLDKIKRGIIVYSKKELNKTLEDFE